MNTPYLNPTLWFKPRCFRSWLDRYQQSTYSARVMREARRNILRNLSANLRENLTVRIHHEKEENLQ